MSWLLPICQLLLSLMEKLIASCKMVALPNIAFDWIFPTATQKEHQDRSWHTRTQISHFPKKKQFLHMLESKLYITCAACSQPLAAYIIHLSVLRYTFVYHDIQLYIAIYNDKCFLRNLSQDRSWHTKSQIAHFLPKKQFWAPISHSFGESMTACCTQSCWCIKIEIRLSKWPSINFNQDRSWHTRN